MRTELTPTHPLLENVPEGYRGLLSKVMSLDPISRPTATELAIELRTRLSILSPREASQPLIEITPSQPVSRLSAAGRTAAGFGLPLLASLGTVEALQALGVDPAEHRGLLALAGIGSGHGAFVGFHRAVTGALPSAAMQAKGLGVGLPAGFFASGIYNSFLNNVVEATPDSWSRSAAPQIAVGVGGGYGYLAAVEALPGAMIALPFMVTEVINQVPSHIYSERTYLSRESAIDQAKHEMARAWNEDDDVLALGALFLSEIPIFTHLPDFFITGDDE